MFRMQWLALLIAPTVAVWACGESDSLDITPPPPTTPTVSGTSPASAVAGSPDLTLTITGTNFADGLHRGSHAAWAARGETTLLATAFVSSTQLRAVIPAALLSNPVSARVLVETGDLMGDVPLSKSNAVAFRVEAPQMGSTSISAISPTSVLAGGPDLTVTITGTNFTAGIFTGSQAAWDAGGEITRLATTFVSTTELTAVIPAALLSSPVSSQVFVETGDRMGDLPLSRSNAVGFTVLGPAPSGAGMIIVYGQTTTLRPIAKGARDVSLDGGPWSLLTEGDSLIYSPVTAVTHQLVISNPCTGTHTPTVKWVNVSPGDTVRVEVSIPAACM